MLPFIALLLALTNNASATELTGNLQLLEYFQEHPGQPEILTTSYGYLVTADEAYNGTRRDANLLSAYSYEQLSSFSLERIPPRGLHASGSGAKGYFQVTHDVSHITNAKVFNGIGKETPLIVRFSTSSGQIGSSELLQRNKGFSFKMYTEEGNMDLLGFNINGFSIKDPVYSSYFAQSFSPSQKTGIVDFTATWDFVANHPAGLNGFIQPFTSLGQPRSYRTMNGHAIHTYQVENDAGEVHFVKFNWFADTGLQFLNDTEYATFAATNPDYHTEEFYNSISNGDYPSYTFCMQVVSKKDLPKMKFDIFDPTIFWPEDEFPNIPVGKLVINKHVDNHFAEIEQLALNPMNLPPGIRGMDQIFFSRSLIYRDGQIHRMGTGFNRIPVNCPLSGAKTFNRDGRPPVVDNGGDTPNYYPNSFNGLVPSKRKQAPLYRPNTDPNPTNYWQIATYYYGLPEDEKARMVRNLAGSLATLPSLVYDKIVDLFRKADECLASKIQETIDAVIASKKSG